MVTGQAEQLRQQVFTELDAAENASTLPDVADRKRLSSVVVEDYLNHWRKEV